MYYNMLMFLEPLDSTRINLAIKRSMDPDLEELTYRTGQRKGVKDMVYHSNRQ